MITATPNSVRWDHINRVTYRFQALNFQSDVLEALVLNSPPLTRRSRRKPIIRAAPDKLNSSQNKVDFIKVRKAAKRSYSFDDGFVDRINNDVKLNHGSDSERKQFDRLTNGEVVHHTDLRQHCMLSRLKQNAHTNGLRYGIVKNDSISSICTNDDESTDRSNRDPHGYENVCEQKTINHDVENLKNKSKEYLVQLVLDLQQQLTDEKENREQNKTEEIKRNESNSCCCGRLAEPSSVSQREATEDDSMMKETIMAQMKQLETEVQRTRKIATMFESELSCLKDKVSNILNKSHKVQQETTITDDKAEPVVTHRDTNCLRTETKYEFVDADIAKQNENEQRKLANSGTNSSYLDKASNIRNCDVVSVLG